MDQQNLMGMSPANSHGLRKLVLPMFMKFCSSLTAVILPFALLSPAGAQSAKIQVNAKQITSSISPYRCTGAAKARCFSVKAFKNPRSGSRVSEILEAVTPPPVDPVLPSRRTQLLPTRSWFGPAGISRKPPSAFKYFGHRPVLVPPVSSYMFKTLVEGPISF